LWLLIARGRRRLFSEVTSLQKMMDAGQLASPSKQSSAGVLAFNPAVDNHQSHGAAGLQFAASAMSGAHFVAKIGGTCENIGIRASMLTSGRSIRF